MWTISELKESAKEILRNNYWMCVVVSLILGFSGGYGGGYSGGYRGGGASEAVSEMQESGVDASFIAFCLWCLPLSLL